MVVPGVGAVVGLPLFGAEAGREALVFACATVGQVAAFGQFGGIFVAVDGYLELVADALSKAMCILDGLLHRDVADGDEGAHVGGTLARMGAVMLAHIYQFGGFLDHAIGGLASLLGLTDEGDDRAVGGLARIDVQQFHAFNFFDLGGDLVYDVHIAPFADIGHAFDKLFHRYLF